MCLSEGYDKQSLTVESQAFMWVLVWKCGLNC